MCERVDEILLEALYQDQQRAVAGQSRPLRRNRQELVLIVQHVDAVEQVLRRAAKLADVGVARLRGS